VSAPECSRGDIWMLDWSPGRGSEKDGWRPGVIVQCDEGNHAPGARTTILVPLTTRGRDYAFYIPVPRTPSTGLRAPSWANCTQVLAAVPAPALQAIGQALADTLGIA